MKNLILSLIAVITISLTSFGQAPEGFKYQAVIRDASSLILANQPIGIQLMIRQGSAGGPAVYTETFSPTTNGYGLVNLEIGTGTTVDDFLIIDWALGPYFIETSVDVSGGVAYQVMGTNQLMSVPYALYANTAENVTNDAVDDADADPNNELQAVSFSGDTLYLSNGGQVYLGAYGIDLVDDADNDPANEHNTSAQINGNDLEVTDAGGTVAADISSLATEAEVVAAIAFSDAADLDKDATNELNSSAQINGNNLEVTDAGGTVSADISSLATESEVTAVLAFSDAADLDKDATNEIQTISRTGTTVTLSDAGGTFTDSVGVYTAGDGIDITSNVITATSPCGLAIGDTYEGGIIFYLDPSGCHGLISDDTDIGTNSPWFVSAYLDTRAYGSGLFAGEYNTNRINWEQSGIVTAAAICITYVHDGHDDWYLPSIHELRLMNQNIGQGNALGLGNIGGFADDIYWSSTEFDASSAWVHNFLTGVPDFFGGLKNLTHYVRAVRAF